MDDLTTGISEMAERQRQRTESRRIAREEVERETNTICAMKTDSGKCIRRDKRTGQQIALSYDKCVDSASN